jgi:tetratricopeptide (TPR) repeat protein
MDDGDGRVEDAHEVDALWLQLSRCEGTSRADVLDQLGGALVQRGRHAEAREVVEAARVLYDEAGCDADVARCDHNLGVILTDLNLADEAAQAYRSASDRYRLTLRWGEAATSLRAVADLLADAGCTDDAFANLLAAALLHDDAGEPVRAALARMEAAELLLDDHRVDDAEELLRIARSALRIDGALLWVARSDQLLADVARHRGAWDEAFDLVASARAVFDAADMEGDRDRCDDLWCSVLIDAGRPTEAVEQLQTARATRQSEGDPVGVAWCDLHLSRAYDRLGEPDAAASRRRQARAVFDACGLDTVLRRPELQRS